MTQTRGWRLVLAPRDAPQSVRRFAKRARQRRLRAALPWLVALAVAALLGAAAVVVFATPVLGVERIDVAGVSTLSAGAVRRAAGVPDGTPLARVDLRAVERRVRQLKPVRTVAASADFPHTLRLRIEERTAVAAVVKVGGFVLLDAEGVGYLPVEAAPAGLPVLRLADPEPGDATTMAALTVLAALPPFLRAVMTALVAESPTRIRLELTGSRTVVWGDATENEAKVRVLEFTQIAPGRTLDVSAPGVVVER
ncbi:FtsQ-type POTRA domain-containing protein [Dactylosporangium sp. AC04546]|uniref:cell division protein FtsQ/DivIB n=1 Tax=Dactylosporangium sp. AC04546 TaxID=2862460 RepID=UPI001EDE9BFF|nr:FtsQ-type POTRA domain-containing protein [Dactylosporangium sp. AC04546]WVK82115.1 FtsQ-type POTRA domain-containing protein [Dactylosporangium sp. AC04546]